MTRPRAWWHAVLAYFDPAEVAFDADTEGDES